jgi:hypothetical protein
MEPRGPVFTGPHWTPSSTDPLVNKLVELGWSSLTPTEIK